MARAKRICSKPGCPLPAVTSRCQQHEREHDTARGSRTQRGYGPAHIRLRSQWAAVVNSGQAKCARCGTVIQPDQPWHLDHRDDRTGYLGPSHAACNESAAGKASRGLTPGGNPKAGDFQNTAGEVSATRGGFKVSGLWRF